MRCRSPRLSRAESAQNERKLDEQLGRSFLARQDRNRWPDAISCPGWAHLLVQRVAQVLAPSTGRSSTRTGQLGDHGSSSDDFSGQRQNGSVDQMTFDVDERIPVPHADLSGVAFAETGFT